MSLSVAEREDLMEIGTVVTVVAFLLNTGYRYAYGDVFHCFSLMTPVGGAVLSAALITIQWLALILLCGLLLVVLTFVVLCIFAKCARPEASLILCKSTK